MVTIRFRVKPHLKEYLYGKYSQSTTEPIRFPDITDIYHLIFDLTVKRPVNCPVDSGNLEIVLPEMRSSKQPKTYNYIGSRSGKTIEKKIEEMFWFDLRNFIENGHAKRGISYKESAFEFLYMYGISSISEDALVKHYYRWRKKIRNPGRRTRIFKNI